MRILKCQTCRNVWLYTGDLEASCICSRCRTTVRIQIREVPIRWTDPVPTGCPGDPVLPGNTAVPFIDVYDRTLTLAFQVASEDGTHVRTLLLPARVLEDLGVPAQALTDAVLAAGGNTVRSGRYPVGPTLCALLQPAFD